MPGKAPDPAGASRLPLHMRYTRTGQRQVLTLPVVTSTKVIELKEYLSLRSGTRAEMGQLD